MTRVQAAAAQVKEAASTVWRQRVVVVIAFALFLTISVPIVALTPRVYRAGANVLIVNGNSRNDPTISSPDIPALATSTSVLAVVEKNLGLTVPLLTLKQNVTAKPPPWKSSVMRIEYSDPSRDRAAMIANAVAYELASYNNQLSTARYDHDIRSLDAQLVKQKARIEGIDARMKATGSSESVATINKGEDSLDDQLNALQTQRALANAALSGDMAQAEAVASDAQTRSKMTLRDVLQSDPLYRALQAKASEAAVQLTEARARYTDSNAELLPLQAKVNSLEAQLSSQEGRALASPHAFSPLNAAAQIEQRKAEAFGTADRAKVAALDGEIARLSHELADVGPLALMRLEREAAMNEYRSIASHRGTTLLDRADALSLGSVVVVDRALASQAQAVGIGPRREIVMFVLASILLALGCAFFAEQLDPRLRRAAQIESLYGKPVVATLDKCR